MNYRCSLREGITSLSTVYIQYVLDVIFPEQLRLSCPPPEGSNIERIKAYLTIPL
jgi:hypothetical protein